MTRVWMLDELAHAGPEHLDPAFVAGYERKQGIPTRLRTWPCWSPMAWMRPHGGEPGRGDGPVRPRRRPLVRAGHRRRHLAGDAGAAARASRRGSGCEPPLRSGGVPQLPARRAAGRWVHTRNALHQLPDFGKAVALERIGRRAWAGSNASQAGGGGVVTQSNTSSLSARKEPAAHSAASKPQADSVLPAQRLRPTRLLQGK
jgi:hypothetical protein